MNNEPRYLTIKRYIDKNITTKQWNVGHRITTELELAKQFDVSRMTVNKAIRDLVSEGKLIRKPRLGTFVCEPPAKIESPLIEIRNIAEEIENRNNQHSAEVKTLCREVADEDTATKLGVMIGDTVFYSEILHYENDNVIQLEKRWVNALFAPNYLKQDFTQVTPNLYLTDNCPLTAVEHSVEAIASDDYLMESLNIEVNSPVLLVHRRTWSNSSLVSFALLYHPGHQYKLRSKIYL